MRKTIKVAKPLLIIIAGLIVSLPSLLQAQDDVIPGSVSISGGPPTSPQCVGTTNWIEYSAVIGDPSSDDCEDLTPTNTIVTWSATYGSWVWSTNNPAYWTNVFTSAGWYTNVTTCTVTWQGLDCDDNNYDVSTNASVTNVIEVVNLTLSMGNGLRIGITANGHNRMQYFSATVTPSSEANNVTITSSGNLSLTAITNMGGGVLSFGVVGSSKSTATNDAYVTAADSSAGCSVTRTATVIVPSAVGTPHPECDTDVSGSNLVATASTSPAAWGLGAGQVDLVTVYVKFMSVPVVDQFGNACGDLYDGSFIGEGGYPMNQNLSGSSYLDPFGPPPSDFGEYASTDPAVASWPTHSILPMITGTWVENNSVEVDGFSLIPAVVNRTLTASGTDHIKVSWP